FDFAMSAAVTFSIIGGLGALALASLASTFQGIRKHGHAPPLLYRSMLFARNRLQGKLRSFDAIQEALSGKHGLEIGGPSHLLQRVCPVYSVIGSLDNVCFAHETVWEGKRTQEFAFHDKKPAGKNFTLEATDLSAIPDRSYDFVISSHNLEHVANPVKALREWQRVLIANGYLLLVLPDPKWTFDHWREVTPVSHMLEDYRKGTGENDLTHLEEIVENHDYNSD